MLFPIADDTPRLRWPVVTLGIIAACLLVFGYQATLPDDQALRFARAAGLVPWEISHLRDLVGHGHPRDLVPPPLTVLTSMFLHGDLWHVVGNLWFLWLFGSKLEGVLGRLRFALFYLLSGVVAAALQVVASPDMLLPMIGASGAIAGVLGGYAITFPRARVRCLLFLLLFATFVELPASLMLGLWFLGQFVAAGAHQPGIAWFAHIGGFLSGLALGRLLLPRGARGWASRRSDEQRVMVYDPSRWRPRPHGPASW